jgi:hypothetical protein
MVGEMTRTSPRSNEHRTSKVHRRIGTGSVQSILANARAIGLSIGPRYDIPHHAGFGID